MLIKSLVFGIFLVVYHFFKVDVNKNTALNGYRLKLLCYDLTMNKPLLLFIIFSVLLVLSAIVYKNYCKSQPDGCKQEKFDEKDFGPEEGIDW
jgi:hypothetical protein